MSNSGNTFGGKYETEAMSDSTTGLPKVISNYFKEVDFVVSNGAEDNAYTKARTNAPIGLEEENFQYNIYAGELGGSMQSRPEIAHGVNDLSKDRYTAHVGHANTMRALEILNRDDLKGLIGRVVADIGAGFSMHMVELKKRMQGKEKKVFCIDPVYGLTQEGIDEGLQKAMKRVGKELHMSTTTPQRIQKYRAIKTEILGKEQVEKNVQEIYENFKKCKKLLTFLQNWKKDEGITYRTQIEKSDKIDVAFCTNLFYKIPEPIKFLTDILENITDGGELIIIEDRPEGCNTLMFLSELEKLGLIKITKEEDLYIYILKKDIFFTNLTQIEESYSDVLSKEREIKLRGEIKKGLKEILSIDEWEEDKERICSIIISADNLINGVFPDNINEEMKNMILQKKEEFLTRKYQYFDIEYEDGGLYWSEGEGEGEPEYMTEFTIGREELEKKEFPDMSLEFKMEIDKYYNQMLKNNYHFIKVSMTDDGIQWEEGE